MSEANWLHELVRPLFMNSPKSLYDSDCEKKAVEYGELLNDMADVLDLPTGSTPADVLDAVKEMRDDWAVSRSAMYAAQRRLCQIHDHITESNYFGGFAAPRGAAKVLHEVLAMSDLSNSVSAEDSK